MNVAVFVFIIADLLLFYFITEVNYEKMQQHVCPYSLAQQFRGRLRTQDPDVLDSLRVSGALCDVTIVVAGQEFRAHKVILAASSPYFKAMFATAFDEKDHSKIMIQDIIPNSFEMILEFIYTGRRMEITVDNVQSLLETASIREEWEVQSPMVRC